MEDPAAPRERQARDLQRSERAERDARRQARANEAIQSIAHGGDLSAETLALSNEFTDETTGRLRGWLRRLRS